MSFSSNVKRGFKIWLWVFVLMIAPIIFVSLVSLGFIVIAPQNVALFWLVMLGFYAMLIVLSWFALGWASRKVR